MIRSKGGVGFAYCDKCCGGACEGVFDMLNPVATEVLINLLPCSAVSWTGLDAF
jgi:hypothetical protein